MFCEGVLQNISGGPSRFNQFHQSANCSNDPYRWLAQFSSAYHHFHAYLSLLLCLLGICLNTLNVVVLCQRHMRNSNNLLLSSLAISDGLVMFIYIIYDIGFRVVPRLENGMSKNFAYLLLVCIVGQNLFHTFSTWIIVVIAAYRLFYIHAGPQARVVCNPIRVWITMALMGIISLILSIPVICAHEITYYGSPPPGHTNTLSPNATACLYEVDYVENSVLQSILFFNSALLVKAIPILLMSILSTILIIKIRETQITRRRLVPLDCHRSNTFPPAQASPYAKVSLKDEFVDDADGSLETSLRLKQFFLKTSERRNGDRFGRDFCRQSIQPTRMLLAVMLMYITAYLPQVSIVYKHIFTDFSKQSFFKVLFPI